MQPGGITSYADAELGAGGLANRSRDEATPPGSAVGDGEDVTERHYLIDFKGRTVIRKWYGK